MQVFGQQNADRAGSNLESTADANREVASGSITRLALLVGSRLVTAVLG